MASHLCCRSWNQLFWDLVLKSRKLQVLELLCLQRSLFLGWHEVCDKAGQVHCEGPRKGDHEFTLGSQGAPVSGFAIRGFLLGLGESSSSWLLCTYHGHFINIAMFIGSFFVELSDWIWYLFFFFFFCERTEWSRSQHSCPGSEITRYQPSQRRRTMY